MQQLRAQVSHVAPRSCPSAASALFKGLDPGSTGAITASDLACFVCHLVGLSPEGSADHAPRVAHRRQSAAGLLSGTPRSSTINSTPRGTPAVDKITNRRSSRTGAISCAGTAVPRSTSFGGAPTASSSFHESSCISIRSRTRRLYGVIERLARTSADSCPTKGEDFREEDGGRIVGDNRYRYRERQQVWVLKGDCSRARTGRESTSRKQRAVTAATAVTRPSSDSKPSTLRSGSIARDDVGEVLITLSAFCRFVEGKKFDPEGTLEGFLWTLSRAGRQQESLSTSSAAAREDSGKTQGQVSSSATTGKHFVSRVVDGTWGTAGTARWGTQGVRRGSSQFANSALAAKHQGYDWVATSRGYNSARSSTGGERGGGAGYLSSRSGSSRTPGGGTDTPTDGFSGPRGGTFLALALSSFDVDGSVTLSSAELISAASQVAGHSLRQEWGDVLVTRFAAGRKEKQEIGERASCMRGICDPGEGRGGVRWLEAGLDTGSNSRKLDVASLVDFLRPKIFSLSIMTPFGKSRCITMYPPYRTAYKFGRKSLSSGGVAITVDLWS